MHSVPFFKSADKTEEVKSEKKLQPVIIGTSHYFKESIELFSNNLPELINEGFKAFGFEFDKDKILSKVIEELDKSIKTVEKMKNTYEDSFKSSEVTGKNFEDKMLSLDIKDKNSGQINEIIELVKQLPGTKETLLFLTKLKEQNEAAYFGVDKEGTAMDQNKFDSAGNFMLDHSAREEVMARTIADKCKKYNGNIIAQIGFKHLLNVRSLLARQKQMKGFNPIFIFMIPKTHTFELQLMYSNSFFLARCITIDNKNPSDLYQEFKTHIGLSKEPADNNYIGVNIHNLTYFKPNYKTEKVKSEKKQQPVIIGASNYFKEPIELLSHNLPELISEGFKAFGFEFDKDKTLGKLIEELDKGIKSVEEDKNFYENLFKSYEVTGKNFEDKMLSLGIKNKNPGQISEIIESVNQLPGTKEILSFLNKLKEQNEAVYFGVDKEGTLMDQNKFDSAGNFTLNHSDREEVMAETIADKCKEYNGNIIAQIGFQHLLNVRSLLARQRQMKGFNPIFIFMIPNSYILELRLMYSDSFFFARCITIDNKNPSDLYQELKTHIALSKEPTDEVKTTASFTYG